MARRYILFHGKRHPREMSAAEVEAFLTHLAVARHVSASTQNQARSALLFLYKEVLEIDLPWLDGVVPAKRPRRLPVVLTQHEVRQLLAELSGTNWMIASLLYGSGLRLLEALRLRVKDVEFERREILVREGKGNKDRVGELLGGFAKAHPAVSLRLEVDNTHAIAKAVREHRLDVGCVEGEVTGADIEQRPWREDALVVCAGPDHSLASRDRLRPADFADVHWIMREQGSATRAQCERMLASLPPGETVLELGQTEAIKQAVIAGLGLACLPEVAVGDAVAAGRLVVLATPFLELRRRLSLLLARDAYHGALVNAFLAGVSSGDLAGRIRGKLVGQGVDPL